MSTKILLRPAFNCVAYLVGTWLGLTTNPLLCAMDTPASTGSEWVAPARAARKQNPMPADPSSINKGKDLYLQACLPCHGATGKGDGPSSATLERNGTRIRPGNLTAPKIRQETDGELFWKISEGNSPMPTWSQTLTEEQRWLVVNYIRTLGPGAQTTNRQPKTVRLPGRQDRSPDRSPR